MPTEKQIDACHAAWENEAERWVLEPTPLAYATRWMISDRFTQPVDSVSFTMQTFATEQEAKLAKRDLVLRAVLKAYEQAK